jgi:hypothetical protein
MFCVCQTKGASTLPPSTVDPLDPYLDRQSVQNSCTSFQEDDSIINPQSFDIDVQIGLKVPDDTPTGTWDEKWYTVPGNNGRFDLGLKYVEPNCFDQDFYIITWQAHNVAASILRGAKVSLPPSIATTFESSMERLDPTTKDRIAFENSSFRREFEALKAARKAASPSLRTANSAATVTTQTGQATPLDCIKTCGDSLDIKCLANTPPDQLKIKGLRDKILATHANSTVATTDILSIFGLSSDPCARGDTRIDPASNVANDGQICVYPIVLSNASQQPVASLQIGRNLSGQASAAASNNANISFFKPLERPTLAFSQSPLQNDFGGSVLQIAADNNGVYFNTPNGCVLLQVLP